MDRGKGMECGERDLSNRGVNQRVPHNRSSPIRSISIANLDAHKLESTSWEGQRER